MMDPIDTDSLATLGLRTTQELQQAQNKTSELGQDDFLELMVAQLRNQDPFSPMENGEFLTQIAQFGTVTGINELQTTIESLSDSLLSNQALQASHLVGRSVLASTGTGELAEGGSIRGQLDLPAAAPDVAVTVYNSAGQQVRRLELGGQAAGPVNFQWDGLGDNGEFAPPGTYFFSAEANLDGRNEAVEAYVANEVRGVTLDPGGRLVLELAGGDSMDFSDVKQIL